MERYVCVMEDKRSNMIYMVNYNSVLNIFNTPAS